MCTLTFAWQTFEDAHLLVAANRDERSDRPSRPPATRDWDAGVVAPQDTDAGGTWIGYNEHGVFVAITNRWRGPDAPAERSRGLLVRDALGCRSAEDAARLAERELDERAYDGFNLVCADEAAAVLIEWDGSRTVRTLDPGVHVVVNVGADGEYVVPPERAERARSQAEDAEAVREALQPDPGEGSAAWLDRASSVLGDHEYGVCVHGDGFGTQSSSVLRMGSDGVSYRFADGPPCRTAYRPVLDSPTD